MVPISYTHNLQARPGRAPRSFSRFGASSLRLIGILILALLAMLYIAQASQGATKQVELQYQRSTANTIDESNKELELQILRQQSLETLSKSTESLGLTPVDNVEHLKTP